MFTQVLALQVAEDTENARKQVDAVIANNDNMAIGAINAMKAAGWDMKTVVVGGIDATQEALAYMKLDAGTPIKGVKIDVAFIGSCTNGRISDFREVAKYIQGHHVAPGVQAIVVPGSQIVAIQAEQEGLPKIFTDAGFEWRGAGCSMCLAMNPDKLVGDQLCASSSNRNFKGRQGSPTGRTILMSPVMVAAAAIQGSIADAREVFTLETPAAVA